MVYKTFLVSFSLVYFVRLLIYSNYTRISLQPASLKSRTIRLLSIKAQSPLSREECFHYPTSYHSKFSTHEKQLAITKVILGVSSQAWHMYSKGYSVGKW